MILIADSGSTKTSWCFFSRENHSEKISTSGINPFFRTTEDITIELRKNLVPKIEPTIKAIYFYGAGIINEGKGNIVKRALQELFPFAKIDVQSDLLAAARATLGTEKGIACILGTGSNSCLYNGNEIVEHVPPLGFILGDEGSGAVLGRKLVGDYLKGIMPENIAQKFRKQFPNNYADFMESVYNKGKPNKFLSRFVPFIKENINNEYCGQLVKQAFEEFLQRNVFNYSDFRKQKISFVGSVAFYFHTLLESAIAKNGLQLGNIEKEPLNGLMRFHKKQK